MKMCESYRMTARFDAVEKHRIAQIYEALEKRMHIFDQVDSMCN